MWQYLVLCHLTIKVYIKKYKNTHLKGIGANMQV